jgi:hypothetical protein
MSAIVVDFAKDAILSVCSGLKFFSDEKGINMIQHV